MMMMMMMIISVTFNRSSRFVFNWILLPRSQVTGSQDLDTFSSLGWAVCCLSSSSLHTLFVCCFFIFFYFIYTYIFLWAFPLCYFKARTGKWGGGNRKTSCFAFSVQTWTLNSSQKVHFLKVWNERSRPTSYVKDGRVWPCADEISCSPRAAQMDTKPTRLRGGKRLSVRIVLPKMFKR